MTKWLENQPKVEFIQKRLRSLDELVHEGFDFVINCTGVGARFFVNDTNIRPISGHVLSIKHIMILVLFLSQEFRIKYFTGVKAPWVHHVMASAEVR